MPVARHGFHLERLFEQHVVARIAFQRLAIEGRGVLIILDATCEAAGQIVAKQRLRRAVLFSRAGGRVGDVASGDDADECQSHRYQPLEASVHRACSLVSRIREGHSELLVSVAKIGGLWRHALR